MGGYLELFRLGKIYETRRGPAVIVRGFDLSVARGEFVTLIGHSGCGKSTVLTMVAGLNSISAGGVVVDGKEIMGPGPDRGVVFQSPCLLPWLGRCRWLRPISVMNRRARLRRRVFPRTFGAFWRRKAIASRVRTAA